MESETSTPFTMPVKVPQLLDLGPLSLELPTKREHTYSLSILRPLSRSLSPPPSTEPFPTLHPYPPSSVFDTPSDSDDSDDSDAPLPPSGLRTSVAALPESKLRRIMVKLAASNPRFHRAIMKELACAREFTGDAVDTPPETPIKAGREQRRRKRHARKEHMQESDVESLDEASLAHEPQRNFKNLSVTTVGHACVHQGSAAIHSNETSTEEYVYHPGHLDEEVYEFFSPSTNHEPCKVVRTVTMWTCCDEDEWSPGCVSVPAFADHSLRDRDAQVMMNISSSRAFSDSDLEHRYDSENGMRYKASTIPGYGYRSG
ncbi:hypothetical protein D9619_004719 [Psilocybe cf. subviscida]|uniref:Uncharacterized protein n=1 Tax=Psilocybe cf. subviscida TaxID=2480587 RepID=A0A8H5F8N9_9AGAR|nr:hypothetical protein D9619_004719 [Psilocybe cf. subviscida]